MSEQESLMDIVMLAAGTSSRMGSTNKMLLPFDGIPMVPYCCLQALEFLASYSTETDTPCRLIVVTGYRRQSVEKALLPCKIFIEKIGARLEMLIVNNPDYRSGQFSSTKPGVEQVNEDSSFFISLADMPLIKAENYSTLVPLLKDHDAVRPFYENNGQRIPGHPVLHASRLKQELLKYPDSYTVSKILSKLNIFEPSFTDLSWIKDIDESNDYKSIIGA